MLTKAACDQLPQVPFSLLCITSEFPLDACDAHVDSLYVLGEFAIISCLIKFAKGILKWLKGSTCDAQAAKEYM
jgi:hypothetical protein